MTNVNWITVFTRTDPGCHWCDRVKELLRVYGHDFYEKDISKNKQYYAEFLEKGHRAVPQVYIETNLVGGYEKTKNYFRDKFFESHPNKIEILKELGNIE